MEELTASRFHLGNLADAGHVAQWLADFEAALRNGDRAELELLFTTECHWRDLLAFTCSIRPHEGVTAIVDRLMQEQRRVRARKFDISADRTSAREVKRVGVEVIEAILEFETEVARSHGVVRLLDSQPDKAWGLMTSLEELKGHEAPVGGRRPSGADYSCMFGGKNWADRRMQKHAFKDREPAVMIVGAGQAGLSVAAQLRLIGEQFQQVAGVKLQHVPCKGAAQALNDVIGGAVQIYFTSVPLVLQQIRSGKLRPLAVTSAARLSDLPGIETVSKTGFKGFDAVTWFGILAPPGTAGNGVTTLSAAYNRALQQRPTRAGIAQAPGRRRCRCRKRHAAAVCPADLRRRYPLAPDSPCIGPKDRLSDTP